MTITMTLTLKLFLFSNLPTFNTRFLVRGVRSGCLKRLVIVVESVPISFLFFFKDQNETDKILE
jgi:hypothetical protein